MQRMGTLRSISFVGLCACLLIVWVPSWGVVQRPRLLLLTTRKPTPPPTLSSSSTAASKQQEEQQQQEQEQPQTPILQTTATTTATTTTTTTTGGLPMYIPTQPDAKALRKLNRMAGRHDPSCTPTAQYKVLWTTHEANKNQQQQPRNQSLSSFSVPSLPVSLVLQALDEHGNAKTVGGDEFYLEFVLVQQRASSDQDDNPTTTKQQQQQQRDARAVGMIQDLHDGTYHVQWQTPPFYHHHHDNDKVSTGSLLLYFQYTCGWGRLYHPRKQDWKYGGNYIMQERGPYVLPNITLSNDVIAPHVPPTTPDMDLGRYDTVVCLGDSVMNHFCGQYIMTNKSSNSSNSSSGDGGDLQYRPAYKVPTNIRVERNINTWFASGRLRKIWKSLQTWHDHDLRQAGAPYHKSVALLMHSYTWDVLSQALRRDEDVQGQNFTDHLATIRQVIARVRETYPQVHIIWKSPQAMHIHQVYDACFRDRKCTRMTRYLSSSLVEYLYEKQKALAEELDVQWLDVYQESYTSFRWLPPADGRHYSQEWNKRMLQMFYPNDKFT